MLFSPAVGHALVLAAVGFSLVVLLAVGYALVLPAVGYTLSVLLIFPCCWVCSSRGPPTRIVFFLATTTGSLALVPSLIPLSTGSWLWFCLCFLQRHFVVVYDSVVRLCHLQHHYSALNHFVIVVSR